MYDFKKEVDAIEQDMLKDIESLVNINSVYDENTTNENAPYGAGCRKALDKMLELGKRDGFKVDETDGYAGSIEIGEGDQTFGILGHLDVVPVNNVGWNTDPFIMKNKDGFIYGRGVADDKGPLLAGYYAAKIINKLNIPTKMKTKIIFGCDEERGSSCLQYYFTKRPFPDMSFTPDAEFPVVYGEKAIIHYELTGEIEKNSLIAICAGTRANIVPESCIAIVEGKMNKYTDSFNRYLRDNQLQGTIEEEGNHTRLTLKGKAAHASTPDEGINAVNKLTKYLATISNNSLVEFINNYLCDNTGEALGINFKGEMGPLTVNLGVIRYRKKKASITLDLRCSNDIDFKELDEKIINAAKKYNLDVKSEKNKALYVDPKSELITKLHKAYVDVTGDNSKPQAIGGGTYAKTCPNCVAFGAELKGDVSNMHGNNEQLSIKSLKTATEIYCHALYDLIKKD
ncbi:MAG: dipeptidase PepV [Thomasclavelia sp.]|jgi:succinyl-diaminopimelate desuccinylase|nr:dipeptidase PepV [Thomasclavelia sp.]